jgi:hypothetical protein
MKWAEFLTYAAEMRGREDPLRYRVHELKDSQDVGTPPPQFEMPATYGDRNISNDGAVTKS